MNRTAAALILATPILGFAAANWALAARGAAIIGPDSPMPPACTEACHQSNAVTESHTLTLDGANRVLAVAIAFARERNAGGAIAVVDSGGSLIAFQRLDGTFAAGADVSIGKARTAAMFKKPTKAFEDSINNGRIALAAVHQMTPLQGGVPITHEGHVVGGIGVSGAHSQVEDEEVAIAGAAAIEGTSTAAGR